MIYLIVLIVLCWIGYVFLKDYSFKKIVKKIEDFDVVLERYSRIDGGYAKEYKKFFEEDNPKQLCLRVMAKYKISINKEDKEKCKTLVLKIYSITKTMKKIIDYNENMHVIAQINVNEAIKFSEENKADWDNLHTVLDQLIKDVRQEI